MIAVCNTSPISSLVLIERLSLLARQFSQVLIPPEVAQELDAGGEVLGDWRTSVGATALVPRGVVNRALLTDLSATLHPGEAAAVALAVETADSILVIDEADGRRTAARLGLRITGTVGILVTAKRLGHIAEVKSLLLDLRTRAGFWLADDVVRHALELADES